MRKSFFGQRPHKGKPQGAKRGGAGGSRSARGKGASAGGGEQTRKGRGASEGGPFRERPGGSREGRNDRPQSGGRESGSRIRFKKRAAHSGARDARTGEGEQRDGRGSASSGSGARFRDRPVGGSRPDRAARADAREGGGRSSSTSRFHVRPARGAAGGETRKDQPRADGGRGGPPPGVRVRERPPSAGSRYDRMDRPDRQAPPQGAHVRRPGPGGKRGQARTPSVAEPMRIAKAMARAGLCSRREAERWIADGRVSINGQVLKTPGVEVKPKDRVLVDGQPLPVAEPSQLWRYNKPKGLVTTHDDPQGRPTVFDNLPPGLPRVISVGRLDFNTEGLILLTNDGELARHLELPATGWLRRYRVRAKGRVTQADLDGIKGGVEIEGVRYGPVEAAIDTVQGANIWLTIGIREGKNREVRKVLSHLGLEVNRLIRISFGPFQLMDLKPGEAESIKRRVLADQLGPQLAQEFGLVEVAEAKAGKKPGGQRPGSRPGRPTDGRGDA